MAGLEVSSVGMRAVQVLPHDGSLVNAVVDLSGDIRGAVILRLSKSAVLPIASAFAHSSVSYDDAVDAVGEVANMITGNAKHHLYGRFASMSPPRVLTCDLSRTDLGKLSPWLILAFSTHVGEFYLSTSFHDSTDTPRSRFNRVACLSAAAT